MEIFLIILAIVLGLGAAFGIFALFFVSYRIYRGVLIRTSKDKWGRSVSEPSDPQMCQMWDLGLEWGKKNRDFMKVVSIHNDGLKLVGEYYDFGFERTVIIVQGRSECCKYSYFYAMPYRNAGYNVLVIDTRAHGLSEGKYNTAGVKESKDLLAWARYVHDELNQVSIIFHSICVGGCSVTLAVTSEECPDYIEKLVIDGLFVTFVESFATHMQEKGHSKSPIFWMIWFWFRILGGVSVRKAAPIKVIDKVRLPVLFLYGKEDKYSLPEKSQILFDKCGSPNKNIVWFEHGAHSRLRLVNTEDYDKAVTNFVK